MNRIVELAKRIQQRTLDIDIYLQQNDLPTPSFDEDGPSDLNLSSGEMAKARSDVLEATLELHDLILGPAMCLRPVVGAILVDMLCLLYKLTVCL